MIPTLVLPCSEWHRRRDEHRAAVRPYTTEFRARRGRGISHPIYDFLFTYYSFSSTKLEWWHPGLGIALEVGTDALRDEFLRHPAYELSGNCLVLSRAAIRPQLVKQLLWVRELCKAILKREPRFSCFGLHEWAMVYRAPETRHSYPLRLAPETIARVVEEAHLCCSHFDAFRFFTPAATKLNVLQPRENTRVENEQGGCIHANMDLYRWAFKLLPLVSSDLVRKSFLLAIAAREVDMRASPYDFQGLGFAPITIETADGRREYQSLQRDIAERARALRLELLAAVEALLSAVLPGRTESMFQHATLS